MTKTLVCIAVGWLAVTQAQAVTAPDWKPGADAMVSALSAQAPGASVAIYRDGREVYANARGLASVELGVPLNPRSVFRVGSLTKTVTAATVMQLNAQGKLDLDAPIARWLPTFPRADVVTVRQLLSHTSGVSDGWTAQLTDTMDPASRLKAIAAAPPDFPSGTDWRYSNSGYMLLGAIIEKITGKSWFDAERDLVLAPLGIRDVAYHGDDEVVPGLVPGYTVDARGELARPVMYSITGPGAAGGLSASANGIAALLHGLATGRVPGATAFRQMIQPARIGTVDLPYGLGMVPGTVQGVAVTEHSGGIEGYLAHYIYVPSVDLAVVVLENSDAPTVSPRSLARRLTALVLGKPYRIFAPVVWEPGQLDGFAGTYRIPGGGAHVIEVHDGAAWIHRDDGPAKRLVTSAGDILTYAGDGIDYVHVVRDAKGHVVAIEFHDDGRAEGRREHRQ
ncbi:MAG: serine hydrolase [Luteibacter sp.]